MAIASGHHPPTAVLAHPEHPGHELKCCARTQLMALHLEQRVLANAAGRVDSDGPGAEARLRPHTHDFIAFIQRIHSRAQLPSFAKMKRLDGETLRTRTVDPHPVRRAGEDDCFRQNLPARRAEQRPRTIRETENAVAAECKPRLAIRIKPKAGNRLLCWRPCEPSPGAGIIFSDRSAEPDHPAVVTRARESDVSPIRSVAVRDRSLSPRSLEVMEYLPMEPDRPAFGKCPVEPEAAQIRSPECIHG